MSDASPKMPGCPECHRKDAVTAFDPAQAPPEPARVYEEPNFLCTFCEIPFRYDRADGRYAPFRVRSGFGEVSSHVFDPRLGPGDAPMAWAKAEERIRWAREADAGESPFDCFGSLKRAGTWMMKGALAAAGHAPEVPWRYGETIFHLLYYVSWDAHAAMSDFGGRVTSLLYGRPIDDHEPRRFGAPQKELPADTLRELAGTHIAEAEILLAHLRDGGPLPESAAPYLRGYRRGAPRGPQPWPPRIDLSAPEEPLPDTTVALYRASRLLSKRAARLDFTVDARVMAVGAPDADSWDGPIVALRVPVNGLWWEEDASLTSAPHRPEDDEGHYADVVLRWGTRFPAPEAGAWVRVRPFDAHGRIEAVQAEAPVAREAWLRSLEPAPRPAIAQEDERVWYEAVPIAPLRPRVEWVCFHDGVSSRRFGSPEDDGNAQNTLWPVFPDDPLLSAFFGEPGHYVGGGPTWGPPEREAGRGVRGLLYQCECGYPDCSSVEAREWLDPVTGLVIWSDVVLVTSDRLHLGPDLAFDADHYARAAHAPDRVVRSR
ncbi:MAG: hypothetical protein ACQEXJ_06110 [Myxococcota bacterium]